MINLKNITKTYYNKKNSINALLNISLKFDSSGFYVIFGKSGCGKTTLLNIISGNEKPTSGEIIFEGNPSIGFVFQNNNLINDFTLLDNLCIFSKDLLKINELLKKFGLYDKRNIKVRLLSGGEKQRVAIIRCLIQNKNVLLFDEATANLDEDNATEILNFLKELSKDILIIFVSHNERLLSTYADHIIKMNCGNIISHQVVNNILYKSTETCEIKEKKFSLKYIFKYAFFLFKTKKVMNVIAILLLCITMVLLTTTFHMFFYSASDIISDSIADAKYQYIPVSYEAYSLFSDSKKNIIKGNHLKDYIGDDTRVYNYIISTNPDGIFEISPVIYVINNDELKVTKGNADGLVISSFLADFYFGEENPVGKRIKLRINDTSFRQNEIEFYISGVIEVDYDSEQLRKFKSFQSYRNANYDLLKQYYCTSYLSIDYLMSIIDDGFYIDGDVFNESVGINDYLKKKTAITKDSNYDNIGLEEDEIIISSKYKTYFSEQSLPIQYTFRDISKSPNYSIYVDSINIFEVLGTVNIIQFQEDVDGIIVSDNQYKKIFMNYFSHLISGISISKDDLNSKKISSLHEKNIYFSLNEYGPLYQFQNTLIDSFGPTIIWLTISIVLISILFILYSSLNIYNQKQKEIYILKVFKINKFKLITPFFIFELSIFIISFILSIPLSTMILNYLGKIFLSNHNINFTYQLLYIRFYQLFLSFIFGFIFVIIAIILPYVNISKKEISVGIKNSD